MIRLNIPTFISGILYIQLVESITDSAIDHTISTLVCLKEEREHEVGETESTGPLFPCPKFAIEGRGGKYEPWRTPISVAKLAMGDDER